MENQRCSLSGLWGRRSEEHTSELQSLRHLVCRLLLEKKNKRADGEARFSQLRTPQAHPQRPGPPTGRARRPVPPTTDDQEQTPGVARVETLQLARQMP